MSSTEQSWPVRRHGSPYQIRLAPFATDPITAHWEQSALVLRLTLGGETVQTVTLKLASNGRQLIREIAMKDAIGDRLFHQVLDKQ